MDGVMQLLIGRDKSVDSRSASKSPHFHECKVTVSGSLNHLHKELPIWVE